MRAASRTDGPTMEFDTSPAPHSIAGHSVSSVMFQVLLALVPLAITQIALFGPGLLLQLSIACPTALAAESFALRMRGREAGAALRDGSALVTACLLAVALPPSLPWWLTALGISFGVLIGKHLYGGLGQNPFNPAMVGYAMLLVSFPVEMTHWPLPVTATGALDWPTLASLTTQTFYRGLDATLPAWDAFTGATALDALRTGLSQRFTMSEIFTEPGFGKIGSAGYQWLNAAALLGGIFLLYRGIIRWQIPLGMLAAMTGAALLSNVLDPGRYAGALFHLFSGATMLGAFFIATDPVSAATSDRGRLIYGAGIGALTWGIRTWGGYPDGVAFAVLLMNLAAPLIDRYTIPRIYGHAER